MNDQPEHDNPSEAGSAGEPGASGASGASERGSLWREPSTDQSPEGDAPAGAEASPPSPSEFIINKMLGRDETQDAQDAATAPDDSGGDEKPLVRLVDVYKAFGDHKVLDGVSLDIYPGKSTVIIGPSGAGKSVLLKHIAGLLKPDRGEVWFGDQRVDKLSENDLVAVRKQMGMLFQMGALFDSMNVAQNIMFPLVEHNRRMSAATCLERARTMLNIVGLKNVEDKVPADLSGGQRKRVALARAIILEPKLVLYDEPTTGLDPIRSDVINELILRLTKHLGIASIVVTHDMVSADKIADRMVMLYDGKIVIDGSPQEFHQTDNELVKRFILGQADQEDLQAIREGIEPVARH